MDWSDIIDKLTELSKNLKNTLGNVQDPIAESVSQNLRDLANSSYDELLEVLESVKAGGAPQISGSLLLKLAMLDAVRKERAKLLGSGHNNWQANNWGVVEANLCIERELGEAIQYFQWRLEEDNGLTLNLDDPAQYVTLDKLAAVVKSDTPMLDLLMGGKEFRIVTATGKNEDAQRRMHDEDNPKLYEQLADIARKKEEEEAELLRQQQEEERQRQEEERLRQQAAQFLRREGDEFQQMQEEMEHLEQEQDPPPREKTAEERYMEREDQENREAEQKLYNKSRGKNEYEPVSDEELETFKNEGNLKPVWDPVPPEPVFAIPDNEQSFITPEKLKIALDNLQMHIGIEQNLSTLDGARGLTNDEFELTHIQTTASRRRDAFIKMKQAIEAAYVTNSPYYTVPNKPLEEIQKSAHGDLVYSHLENPLLERGKLLREIKASELVELAQPYDDFLPERKPPEKPIPGVDDEQVTRALNVIEYKLQLVRQIIAESKTNGSGVKTALRSTNSLDSSEMRQGIGELSLRAEDNLIKLRAAVIRIGNGVTNYMPGSIDYSALAMMDVILNDRAKNGLPGNARFSKKPTATQYEKLYWSLSGDLAEGDKITMLCDTLMEHNHANAGEIAARMTPAILLQFAGGKDYRSALDIGKVSDEVSPEAQQLNREDFPELDKIHALMENDPSRNANVAVNLQNLKQNSGLDPNDEDTVFDLSPEELRQISAMLRRSAEDNMQQRAAILNKEGVQLRTNDEMQLSDDGAKAWFYEDSAYAFNQLAGAFDALAMNDSGPFERFFQMKSLTTVYLAGMMKSVNWDGDTGNYGNADDISKSLRYDFRYHRTELEGVIKQMGGFQEISKALHSKSALLDWCRNPKASKIQTMLDHALPSNRNRTIQAYSDNLTESKYGINFRKSGLKQHYEAVGSDYLAWGTKTHSKMYKKMRFIGLDVLHALAFSANFSEDAEAWKQTFSRDALKTLMLCEMLYVGERTDNVSTIAELRPDEQMFKFNALLHVHGFDRVMTQMEHEYGHTIDLLYQKLSDDPALRETLTHGISRSIQGDRPLWNFLVEATKGLGAKQLALENAEPGLNDLGLIAYKTTLSREANFESDKGDGNPEYYRDITMNYIRDGIDHALGDSLGLDVRAAKWMLDYVRSIDDPIFLRALSLDISNVLGPGNKKLGNIEKSVLAGPKQNDRSLKKFYTALQNLPNYKSGREYTPVSGEYVNTSRTITYGNRVPDIDIHVIKLTESEKLSRKYRPGGRAFDRMFLNIRKRMHTFEETTLKARAEERPNRRKIELLEMATKAYAEMAIIAAEGEDSNVWKSVAERCKAGKSTEWETIFLCENVLKEEEAVKNDPNAPHPYTDRLNNAGSLAGLITELHDSEPFVFLLREHANEPFKNNQVGDGMRQVMNEIGDEGRNIFAYPGRDYSIQKYSESVAQGFGTEDPDDPDYDPPENARPARPQQRTASAEREDIVSIKDYVKEIKRLNGRLALSEHSWQHNSPAYTQLRRTLTEFVTANENKQSMKLGDFMQKLDPVMELCEKYQITHRTATSMNANRLLRMKTINYLQTLGNVIKRGIPYESQYAQKALLSAKIANSEAADKYKTDPKGAIHALTHSSSFQSDVWRYDKLNKLADVKTANVKKMRERSGSGFKSWFESIDLKKLFSKQKGGPRV